ncbi:hypothetical protein WR25_17507 [Diploscapter pachys]|uniref:Uncharacterized protein n=1 Tax=Diploscapter pachys TaxID=2018661 RepID=A0A2A2L6P3_9BILA|nr:hypothetical protein WR25_17507 [Diploscapter pachys]
MRRDSSGNIASRGDANRIKAKKGLSDNAKDIQIKALQTGLNADTMMASFFNESDLCECLKNCDFCRILEKVIQQANALKTQRQESTHEVRDEMEKLVNHSDMNQGKRKKKRNILDSRMEKEEAVRLKTAVQGEFECLKARRVTHHCSSSSDSSYNHTGSERQFLPDRQPADIEYNSCYLQSKTLSSYNYKAAQSYVVFI